MPNVAILITSLQIAQMAIGLFITAYAHFSIGNNCPNVYPNLTSLGKYFQRLPLNIGI